MSEGLYFGWRILYLWPLVLLSMLLYKIADHPGHGPDDDDGSCRR